MTPSQKRAWTKGYNAAIARVARTAWVLPVESHWSSFKHLAIAEFDLLAMKKRPTKRRKK